MYLGGSQKSENLFHILVRGAVPGGGSALGPTRLDMA